VQCRVVRGGSWFNDACSTRSAYRDGYKPGTWYWHYCLYYGIGFLVARTP